MKTTSNIIRRAACALLVTLLTTMTAFAAVGDVVGSGTCGTNLTWTLTDNGGTVTLSDGDYSTLTLTITGTGAMYDYTSDPSPWGTADNIRNRITTLNLPEGITHIGDNAFYFTNYSGPLVIPSTVKTIGASGFFAFNGATSVTIPASVTSIGEKGLWGFGHDVRSCTVTFAEGSQLTSIGANAFNGVNANLNMTKCTKLTAITAEYVFRAYKKTVTFPKTLTSVCANAFRGTDNPTVRLAYQGFLVINNEYQSYNANGAIRDITDKFSITTGGSKAVTIFQRSDGLTYNTKGPYYEVNSEQGLVNLGDLIEADKSNAIAGMTFKLTADLDFTNMPTRSVNGNSGNFHPIGLVEDASFDGCFSGHFDGQNHTIKALRYTNKLSSGSNNNEPVGLFKKVDGSNAVVERVVLIDPQMSGQFSGCGGIAGVIQNGATIRNCPVLGGSIVSNGGKSGGIVGSNSDGGAATIEGCTVIGTSVQDGMIIGYANSQQTIKDCIYYAPDGKGICSNYYTDGGGNSQVYQVTLGENVTATGATYTHALLPGKAYYAEGATVNLGHDSEGYVFLGYTTTGVTLSGSATSFTMPANDVIIAATISIDPAQFSVNDAGTEYTIHTAGGWNVFCDLLAENTKGYFSGKTVRLGADITVRRMAGGQPFTGTFDGQNHTLTLAYGTADAPIDAQFVAPFIETSADGEHQPTFCNLTIGGTIYATHTQATNHDHVGGLIGHLYGTVTIERCTSLVEIHAKGGAGGFVGLCEHSVSFNDCHSAAVVRSAGGNNSGFVAWSRSSAYTIDFTGCLFDGKLLQQNGKGDSNGGFIGWKGDAKTVNITNCLCAPAPLADGETMASSNSATFSREHSNYAATITNCYYTAAFDIAQGKATHTVTAGTDVTIKAIALTGTATQYTVSGITAYSGGGLQRGETLYYGSDDQLSLTLSNSATGAPLGYQYGYTASAGTLSGTTLTMPDEDVTISVNTAALLSDGQQHEVSYMTADGTTKTAKAIALDGHEAVDGNGNVRLAAGTYYVGIDIAYANKIVPNGNITLILANGKTMTLNDDTPGIDGMYNLTIYGQSLDDDAGTLRYDGTEVGIYMDNYEQHSGNVSITTSGSLVNGIYALVTLRGGTLTVSADGDDARAISSLTHSILGGQLTANATGANATGIFALASSGTAITLGWTRPDDRITASSISTNEGTVAVATGQALIDGSGHIYTGTLSTADLAAISGQTLRPCLALADAADNTAAIDDHASQTLAVALSGRTLYKDGSWNTLCLPFSVSTESGTLSGDGVKAMTLNTETSNLTDGTLTLNFTAAETIPAGTPFIIKWDESGTDIKNPVFDGVTVSNATNDATVEGVLTFTGTYAPVSIGSEGDNTKLYLGAANKLYYPTKTMTIGTHRAYFQLSDGITAAEPTSPQQAGVRAFVLNFGDDEATGIISVHDSGFMVNGSDAWYTLDGRKLDGQPTAKGLYIHGGKKVAIK